MFLSDHTKLLVTAAALAAVLHTGARPAEAEFRIEPAVLVSEEYNDNIFLERRDPDTDYITRIVPSVRVRYDAPLWDWDLSYAYDYRYFATHPIEQKDTHNLNFLNHTRIVSSTLFLDVKDVYRRVSLFPARDFTQESLFLNQSDSNVFTVNPYITLRPSPTYTITTGYLFVNTWYEEETAVDKIDHGVYLQTEHELTSRISMTTGYKYTNNRNLVQKYTRQDLYAAGTYEYEEGGTLFVSLGNSWFDFPETNDSTNQLLWTVRTTHKLPTITLSFLTAINYIDEPQGTTIREDSYVLSVAKETERTLVGASAGLREYRSAKTKHLRTSTYFGSGTLSHALTQQWKIAGALNVERLVDDRTNNYTSRYLPGVRLEYQALETVVFAADYRYTNVYSPDFPDNNYQNNRFTLEMTARF